MRHHVAAQVHDERLQPVLGQQAGHGVGYPAFRDAPHVHCSQRVFQLRERLPARCGARLGGRAFCGRGRRLVPYAQRAPVDVRERLVNALALGNRSFVEVPEPHDGTHGDVEPSLAVRTIALGCAQHRGRVGRDGHGTPLRSVQSGDIGVRERAREASFERAARGACGSICRTALPRIAERLQGDDGVERVEQLRCHSALVGARRLNEFLQGDGVVCSLEVHAPSIGQSRTTGRLDRRGAQR